MMVQAQDNKELVSVNPSAVTTVAKTDHNPTKALLLSIIPGGGQIYNGQAWKIPIFYAGLGTVGYFAYNYYSDMMMFRKEYLRVGQNGTSELPGYEGLSGYYLYNYYQSSNKNFQLFTIITVAVYGLNLLDAYVFGHLYDFNVSDDLTMHISPSVAPDFSSKMGFAPSVNLSFTF
ncbi:MAG: hypothetical protein II633_04100 [Bacteroidales bacterium]|nr:hypothetical protein [Bacteroidales bacterium]MBQ3982935.1 hypothetical protein [Bacteroidales bacterium]